MESKANVDSLLEGQEVFIEIADLDLAREFKEKAEKTRRQL